MPGPPAVWFPGQPRRTCWACPPLMPFPELCLRLSEQVPEWAGAHLEPADAEGGCYAGRPRGPVCDLAADTAPGAPAPQVGVGGSKYSPKGVKLWPSAGAKSLPLEALGGSPSPWRSRVVSALGLSGGSVRVHWVPATVASVTRALSRQVPTEKSLMNARTALSAAPPHLWPKQSPPWPARAPQWQERGVRG